jgi:transcriptional regulator with XRE-family HTH domain
VTTNPNSAAQKAKEALGVRLRELRKDAGLSGRQLAAATGWHFTRVSKIENGAQAPSTEDIRLWCVACRAEDHIPDLTAQARAINSMYVEFRRRTRAGMRQLALAAVPLYERTERFRIYEHHVVPGLFQTAPYMRAAFEYWTEFLGAPNDLDQTIAARMARQSVVYDGARTFAIVLEEAVLRTRFGSAETMAGQLDRLLSVMSLANVALGIIPSTATRNVVGATGFWIFDDKLVRLETPTASIEVSQPQETAMYRKMFDDLRRPAVYGKEARALIIQTQRDLNVSN